MNRASITRRMRAEVIKQADRAEHWLRKAQQQQDAGDADTAFCLRLVARHRSDDAFAVVANAQVALAKLRA